MTEEKKVEKTERRLRRGFRWREASGTLRFALGFKARTPTTGEGRALVAFGLVVTATTGVVRERRALGLVMGACRLTRGTALRRRRRRSSERLGPTSSAARRKRGSKTAGPRSARGVKEVGRAEEMVARVTREMRTRRGRGRNAKGVVAWRGIVGTARCEFAAG